MSLETLPRPLTTTPTPEASRLTRVWRGPAEEERWVRPALVGLLTATAFLYLWGLGASGWANSFYSAAAQAGSESWKAFFFGSSDAANSITVDKPPASLWVMAASVRLFGVNSWSLLVPEALMGVASVGLLFATVRRAATSAAAGLIAGAVLALTPVAGLMFRFNNPDALLVLLMIAAAAASLRAIETTWNAPGSRQALRWWTLAGALMGFAFLTKMLQAFLVLPGFGLAYLLMCARQYSYAKRIRDLAIALAALIVSAGWWIAIVALWPASSRPYIGGSQHNSILELALGYNGLGRLSGNETGSVGGGAAGTGGAWGATGWLRMLGSEVGGQVGWLLPTALLLLAAGLWLALRGHLAGATAALILWGGWLLVTTATFSFMQGIFHAYYTVALAPAIGAIVGIGAVLLWRRREHYPVALMMAAATALATASSVMLLARTPDFVPWLKWFVAIAGLATALMLGAIRHLPRSAGTTIAGIALVGVLAGPAAYTVDTVTTPHSGSIPSAGPTASLGLPGGAGVRMGGGGGGGLLDGSTPATALTRVLEADASKYTWIAAAIGSNNASGYQLATRLPVMAIGGFNGSDPSPTIAQFKAYVAAGRIHYFIAAGGGGLAPGGGTSSSISSWVAAHFTATTVGGVTLYGLSGGAR